jgi:hypothetical protein
VEARPLIVIQHVFAVDILHAHRSCYLIPMPGSRLGVRKFSWDGLLAQALHIEGRVVMA